MSEKYKALVKRIKDGEGASNLNEFNEYVEFFLDESIQSQRFQLYTQKMQESGTEHLAGAKHLLLKQIFEEYIQFSLTEANIAAKNKNDLDAKKIVDQLSKLRDIFKNHDVIDYKDFILKSDSTINEVEVELLFLEPDFNAQELDKLSDAFVKAFKKKTTVSLNKEEFQKKFFNHPLMQCLNAYSDFKTIQKYIDKETIELGNYKTLIQSMLGLREKVNAEEYQGFITFVIHEDLTYGLNNILKDENYKPTFLRDLLKEMADGKPLENIVVKELIEQIRVEHTKNLALNTRKELIIQSSSTASLNDYGFDVNLKNHPVSLVFHGHSTENAGANQREQQANTAFTIRSFEKDTIGLTVLKDEITRTDHHKNFLADFSHMILMSRTEEIVLTGLQFDASNFKFLALDTSLEKLKKGDFLSSNHYIVKADIKRSQNIINHAIGKNDLELLCEKKNAYMSIVTKNKDLFKSVIETTSTNNQLSFQLFSKPFIEFVDALLAIEEDARIKVFTNEEMQVIQDVLSVRCHNLELETAKKKCLKTVNKRDVEGYEEIRSYTYASLSFKGSMDREVVNRFDNRRKQLHKEHVKFFKNPKNSLEACLEYLDNYPINGREFVKGYKTKVIDALKEKIISASEERLLYRDKKKSELIDGIIETTVYLTNGMDITFNKSDLNLNKATANESTYSCRKTLATLIKGKETTHGQKAENIAIAIGLLALADMCGTKLIFQHRNQKISVRETNLIKDDLTEEDKAYFQEQDEKENKKKAKF
jgi:hypothetical protein